MQAVQQGSFIDLYVISLQYSNSTSALQSVADLSTPPKLPKFVSVCMHACKCVCTYLNVCVEVYKNGEDSLSHWPGFNNAEIIPQSSNSGSISLSLIQSVLFWLKQALSGKVQPEVQPIEVVQ